MLDIQKNPLRTRQDLVRAAVQLMTPLVSCLTPEKSRMIVGEGSAHYSEDIAGMEGYSRVLWALVPMLIGHCPEAEPFWAHWREGLILGIMRGALPHDHAGLFGRQTGHEWGHQLYGSPDQVLPGAQRIFLYIKHRNPSF